MRVLLRLMLVAASALSAILVVEGLCRAFTLFQPVVSAPVPDETPLPYRHASYYSQEFRREFNASGGVGEDPTRTYVLMEDFRGTYINVVDGSRVTTDRPANPARRILMFGGSTVFAKEVPDQYTIPSFLQRLWNTHCREPAAVVNNGVPGVTVRQELARLEATRLSQDDIVIFHDGVNDVFHAILEGTPEVIAGLRPDRVSARIYRLLSGWRNSSAIAELILNRMDHRMPRTLTDPDGLKNSLSVARSEYRDSLVRAASAAGSAQARFLHFLQPHLFATPLETNYRRAIAKDATLTPPGLAEAFRAGYPALAAAIEDAGKEGVVSVDLSRVLDVRAVPEEVYLDFVHVNHVGNEIIASAIFNQVAPIAQCEDR